MTYRVYFEETGEFREVKRLCLRCAWNVSSNPSVHPFILLPEDAPIVPIVSPSGIGHLGHPWRGSDHTACGKDATGDRWWHRL